MACAECLEQKTLSGLHVWAFTCRLGGFAQLDDVLGQAAAVGSNLGEQRRVFENTGSKLMTLTAKFPIVNNILNSIRRKKSKVSSVGMCAGVCVLLDEFSLLSAGALS